jgi:alkyl hydroperoxide reductase subunit AhpC
LEKLTLPILLDDTGLVADDYGVTTIPQTVIIDRAGNVHKVLIGSPMWGAEESLLADIQAALDAGAKTPGV